MDKLYVYDGAIYNGSVIFKRVKLYKYASSKRQAMMLFIKDIHKEYGHNGLYLDERDLYVPLEKCKYFKQAYDIVSRYKYPVVFEVLDKSEYVTDDNSEMYKDRIIDKIIYDFNLDLVRIQSFS